MTEQRALTRPQLITQLTKSPHGDLGEYEDVGRAAARREQEFFAHLIAWNHAKGTVRDSRVALPVLALTGTIERAFIENALAHLALLRPRELVRALDFARTVKAPDRLLRRLVSRYLYDLEARPEDFVQTALQHRGPLRTLYARHHFTSEHAQSVLFLRDMSAPAVVQTVRDLHQMTPDVAAAAIRDFKIPFLIARGAAGKLCDHPTVLAALIGRMSPTEVQTNLKWIERREGYTAAAVGQALSAGLKKVGRSKATPLKSSRAADAVSDTTMRAAIRAAQEQSLTALGTIEGRWLLLVDKSGSMAASIGIGREIAALLARTCPEVHLVFFDVAPRAEEVAGLTLAQIEAKTRFVTAIGGTDISCGVTYAIEQGWEIDGIAIVSDGGDNVPAKFPAAYNRLDGAPPIYFYQLRGDQDRLTGACEGAGIDLQTFDLRGSADSYSLPMLVETMRAKRYSLADEILTMPLLTVDDVLKATVGRPVIAQAAEPVTA